MCCDRKIEGLRIDGVSGLVLRKGPIRSMEMQRPRFGAAAPRAPRLDLPARLVHRRWLWERSDLHRGTACAAGHPDNLADRPVDAECVDSELLYQHGGMVPAGTRRALTSLKVVELGGEEIAIQAAKNFRALRRLGVTVRKTIGTVIATRCIESGYELLHNDRDFDPFAKHLGLRIAVAQK
jgi:hypothetical protein